MHPNPVVELTREQIEAQRSWLKVAIPGSNYKETNALRNSRIDALCDMALRALPADAGKEKSELVTNEMCHAGMQAWNDTFGTPLTRYAAIYRAMRSAAPADAGKEGEARTTIVFVTKDGEDAKHVEDGEWVMLSRNPFGHACCDCGLYHQIHWRISDNGSLELKVFRDDVETERMRKNPTFLANQIAAPAALPDAYAIKNDQGYWTGMWNDLETAELVLSKGQHSHKERIVPLYAAPPALPDGYVLVPKFVVDALVAWSGAEPSQSVLARACEEWGGPDE